MNQYLTLEKYKKIENIFDQLCMAAGISNEEKSSLFLPEGNDSDESIFLRLCSSLQNTGHMSKSIEFNGANREAIRKITYDFDAKKVCDNYKSWKDLYDELKKEGIEDNGTGEIKLTNWQKYARGIYSGATFLTNNNNDGFNEVKRIINLTDTKEIDNTLIDRINKISKSIFGLGFSLTCDWLKESGCKWLVKPDVHIVKVYNHLVNLTDDNKTANEIIIKDMFDWANLIQKEYDTDMSAFKLDKMIWLICTGNFYQYDIQIGRDLIIKRV